MLGFVEAITTLRVKAKSIFYGKRLENSNFAFLTVHMWPFNLGFNSFLLIASIFFLVWDNFDSLRRQRLWSLAARTLKYETGKGRRHNDNDRVAGHSVKAERSQKGRGEKRRGHDVMRESRCHFPRAPAEPCGKLLCPFCGIDAHSLEIYSWWMSLSSSAHPLQRKRPDERRAAEKNV